MTVEEALRAVILAKMRGETRNHQRDPGPSEIGGCERKLGGRLAFGASDIHEDPTKWRPQVGTAVHSMLADWFKNTEGWMPDYRVTTPIAGTIDNYHAPTGTVIDYKCVGVTTLKAARAGKVSEKYRTQLALYGLGLANDGYQVNEVALWFLPSAGSLDDAVYWSEPLDYARAWRAVARVDKIRGMLSVAEPAVVLERLSVEEDFCGSCPLLRKYCDGAKPVKPRTTSKGEDVFG